MIRMGWVASKYQVRLPEQQVSDLPPCYSMWEPKSRAVAETLWHLMAHSPANRLGQPWNPATMNQAQRQCSHFPLRRLRAPDTADTNEEVTENL